MINDNKNKAALVKYIAKIRHYIIRPRPRHGHKCTKYKYKTYHGIMMVICIKQHLSNIWSSIHEKVKQHWGWVNKKTFLMKQKRVLNFPIWKSLWWNLTSQFTMQWSWLRNEHSHFQMYAYLHSFTFCQNLSCHWWWG